jgi:hypothetical protein
MASQLLRQNKKAKALSVGMKDTQVNHSLVKGDSGKQ